VRLIRAVGAKTAYIEPDRPGRTDIAKASTANAMPVFNGEIFYPLREAQIIIERWSEPLPFKQ
jgi:hypothetical protein